MKSFPNSDDFDRKGFELFEAGDLEGALKIYNQGLEVFPGNAELMAGKGYMFLFMGEFVGALRSFREGLDSNPLDPELNKGAALALLYLNRPGEASSFAELARPSFSDDDHALFELGIGFYQAGGYDQALSFFEEIERIDPDNSDALLYRALCLHLLDRGPESGKVESLKAALVLEPERPDILEQSANVFFDEGLTEDAVELFEKLAPDDVCDEITLERMIEVFKSRKGKGFRKKCQALRRKLKEMRDQDPVNELIFRLEEEWQREEERK